MTRHILVISLTLALSQRKKVFVFKIEDITKINKTLIDVSTLEGMGWVVKYTMWALNQLQESYMSAYCKQIPARVCQQKYEC